MKEKMSVTIDRLREGVREYAKDAGVSQSALNAVINGEIKWFGGSRAVYRLGLVDPTGAHGGIVVVRFNPGSQKPYSSAYYFEEWFHNIKESATYSTDRDIHALRDLGYEASRAIHAANNPEPTPMLEWRTECNVGAA